MKEKIVSILEKREIHALLRKYRTPLIIALLLNTVIISAAAGLIWYSDLVEGEEGAYGYGYEGVAGDMTWTGSDYELTFTWTAVRPEDDAHLWVQVNTTRAITLDLIDYVTVDDVELVNLALNGLGTGVCGTMLYPAADNVEGASTDFTVNVGFDAGVYDGTPFNFTVQSRVNNGV